MTSRQMAEFLNRKTSLPDESIGKSKNINLIKKWLFQIIKNQLIHQGNKKPQRQSVEQAFFR